MPRIDPYTGCTVATTADLIAADAKRKGRRFEDEADEFWGDIARMEEEDRQLTDKRLREQTIPIIIHAINFNEPEDYDGKRTPHPVKVLAIIETGSEAPIMSRDSGEHLVADCLAANGRVYRYSYETWHCGATYMDPPDGDTTILCEWMPWPRRVWRDRCLVWLGDRWDDLKGFLIKIGVYWPLRTRAIRINKVWQRWRILHRPRPISRLRGMIWRWKYNRQQRLAARL